MSGLSARERELVHALLGRDDARALGRRLGVDAPRVRRELESLLARIAGDGEAAGA